MYRAFTKDMSLSLNWVVQYFQLAGCSLSKRKYLKVLYFRSLILLNLISCQGQGNWLIVDYIEIKTEPYLFICLTLFFRKTIKEDFKWCNSPFKKKKNLSFKSVSQSTRESKTFFFLLIQVLACIWLIIIIIGHL